MQVKIERLVHQGLGLARVSDKVIFIPGVIPGEIVEIELEREKPGYAYGHLVKIIEPSEFRIQHQCPSFPQCGGCQLAHISYPHQLDLKKQILQETFRRTGKFPLEPKFLETIPSPLPLQYRSRARFHFFQNQIGFMALNSEKIIPLQDCLLLREELRDSLPALKKLTQQISVRQKQQIELDFDPESREIFARFIREKKFVYAYEKGVFQKVIPPRKTLLRLLSFVQANPEQNQKMISLILEMVYQLKPKTCLELFAGAGNFSFALAKKVNRLIAIEANQASIELAKLRQRELRVENIEFYSQTSETYLRFALKNNLIFDLIILDPPRAGAQKELDQIIALKPKAIIYISCEPSTLARDLKKLILANYQLQKIFLLDLFPQTYHIETISLWQKTELFRNC